MPGPDGKRGFGGACLELGTKISTPVGIKNIEDVRIGDVVFDEKGKTTVTKTGFRYIDEAISIKSRGRILTGSKDHIHFKYENNTLVPILLSELKIGDFVPLKKTQDDIKNKIILGPKPNGYVKWWKEEIIWSSDLAYVLGLYLADGCYNKNEYRTAWCLGEKKNEFGITDRLENCLKRLGFNPHTSFKISKGTYGESRCFITRITSMGFGAVMDQVGIRHGAKNKTVNIIPKKFIPYLIGGWLDGDGNLYEGTLSGHSESMELIKSLDEMLRITGINASIKNGKCINISTRNEVKKMIAFTTRFKMDKDHYKSETLYASPNMRETAFGWISKISDINTIEGRKVISLETESGTYIANGFITHNCFPKDIKAFIGLTGGTCPTILGALKSNELRRETEC